GRGRSFTLAVGGAGHAGKGCCVEDAAVVGLGNAGPGGDGRRGMAAVEVLAVVGRPAGRQAPA
ncbi:hypothetical protein CEJ63_22630, partial [Acinetobacter baumannii]